ncbi:site-specific integrase [Photobacterium leiognathi]|uniref:site-specific integrase n=1 Tax=Photobacterium leiognathi TaxID=553611 RepID=UPI002981E0A3|nr:site-specific integrase [Photobacterium leiognathi]
MYWIRLFIRFNDLKHPNNMGNHEIERFLNHLAVNRQVSVSTQNQALCAIIFLYRYVVRKEIVISDIIMPNYLNVYLLSLAIIKLQLFLII